MGCGCSWQDLEVVGEDLNTAAGKFNEAALSLVLCSTYGDGEPPDTAAPFFDWLKTQAEVNYPIVRAVFSRRAHLAPHHANVSHLRGFALCPQSH